jgi:ribosomal-protein-alanine N-acetyltransferase
VPGEGERCRIREFVAEDLGSVCEIEVESFPYPYPCKLFLAYQALFPELFLVAECGGRVVGYALAIAERGGRAHVISIAVAPGFRRRGLGRALMLHLEERFRRLGLVEVVLEVAVSNAAAISLYRSLGYSVVGRIQRYYPDGEDAYLMSKKLL